MDTTRIKEEIAAKIVCNCCGATGAAPLPEITHLLHIAAPGQALQCVGCGLIFQFPQPTGADLKAFYDEAAYYDRSPLAGGDAEAAPHLKRRLADLERRLGRKGRLLDVGCAKGAFVAYATSQGWQAEGVDVSAWSTEQARKRGLKVQTGTLEDQHYPDASFDVVHSSHMLEHVPDPLATLKEMRRILRPSGVLAIEVPQEIGSFYENFRIRAGIRPPPELPSPHLYFFQRATFSRLIQTAGFQVISASTRNFAITRRSKYLFGMGNVVTRALGAMDTLTRRGPNLVVLARLRQ